MNIWTEYKDITMKYDLNYIEKLIGLIENSSLTELTLEDGEQAIVLKKEKQIGVAPAVAPVVAQANVAVPSVECAQKVEAKEEVKGTPITSPMVGTFYCAPSPNAKPFVSVGDTVAPGQVVCIVEAMKLMNEIEAEVAGKITKICVSDGEAVEYGQVLMYVE